MDAVECIKARRSIRQFKPDPVSREVLMDIIDIAKWSPSYRNTQPWETIILSGAKKKALTKRLIELLEKDTEICPDLPTPTSWPADVTERLNQAAKKRAEATGRNMNDPEALKEGRKRNFDFYSAPHAIYLFQEASLGPWSLIDMGLFAQSIMLAAKAKGIDTVPQAFVTDYAKDVKKFLSIPDTKRLILGISVGYGDMESPANASRSDRMETDDIVRWIE